MKKRFLYIMMLAGLTACTNDDNIVTEVPTTQAEAPVYQVSIPAGFDDAAQTRAVSIDGTGAMIATFTTTDDISVYNKTKDVDAQDNNYNLKLLHPDANGATAKLTGELTFYYYPDYQTVDENDVLLLTNNAEGEINYNAHSRDYYPQSGTLACLNLFDFASCEVSIIGISGAGTAADPYTLTTSKADFVNAQSMFKFTFTGLPSGVGVKKVTIHSAENKLILYYCPYVYDYTDDVTIDFGSSIADGYSNANDRRQANGPGVVYAALRFAAIGATETDDITFTVEGTDNKTYIATKTSPVGGFKNSKYYTSTIALYPQTVDLATMYSTDANSVKYYAARDGQTLTGDFDSDYGYITIADGATVTLKDVYVYAPDNCDHAPIHCLDDANIIIQSSDNSYNDVSAGNNSAYPAVFVPENKTLTISGIGELRAYAKNSCGAGIGGGYVKDYGNSISQPINCGNIVINGGTNYGDGVTDSSFTYTPPTP